MQISNFMNTNACTARLRSGLSGATGTPERFRTGKHEVAAVASVLSCGAAGIGEQAKGGRVSASGEDV